MSAVGADVESMCSKCGDVWHVVVAMVGDKIAKVECKECHAVHRHRDPKAPARRTSSSARPKRTSKPPEPEAPVVEADLSRPVRAYRASEPFEPGDRVSHVSFGEGVVQRETGPGKMEVLFGDGRKLLACAKPQPQLGKAPRHRFETEG